MGLGKTTGLMAFTEVTCMELSALTGIRRGTAVGLVWLNNCSEALVS